MSLDPAAASPGDAPRFGAELEELRALIARVPKHATVKGMFIKGFLQSLDREGISRPTQDRFIAFCRQGETVRDRQRRLGRRPRSYIRRVWSF
jgi:hypothetical protein